MKPSHNFYFNVYEQKLIARYYDDIKRNCKEQWFNLTAHERQRILLYRSRYGHPEKYDTSTNAGMFIPQELLVLNSDTEKIRKYFTGATRTSHTLLMMLLSEYAKRNIEFEPIMAIVTMMHEAGDGNTSFSNDNIGVNVTSDTIEIVDIFENKSIATIKLSIKEV